MSALGQKRTFRSAIIMSALPPKADIGRLGRDVRFVPKADIPVFRAYRTDRKAKVFYKATPYRPVFSRIFPRGCKTALPNLLVARTSGLT
jgi:hypothetical protein